MKTSTTPTEGQVDLQQVKTDLSRNVIVSPCTWRIVLDMAIAAEEKLATIEVQDQDDEYEIIQDDMMVAGASGPNALTEIKHYAAQYSQDGPIEVLKVTRTKVQL